MTQIGLYANNETLDSICSERYQCVAVTKPAPSINTNRTVDNFFLSPVYQSVINDTFSIAKFLNLMRECQFIGNAPTYSNKSSKSPTLIPQGNNDLKYSIRWLPNNGIYVNTSIILFRNKMDALIIWLLRDPNPSSTNEWLFIGNKYYLCTLELYKYINDLFNN